MLDLLWSVTEWFSKGRVMKYYEQESLAQYCSDWSVMTSDEKYHPLFFKEVMRMEDGKEVRCMERYTPKINLSMKTSI